MALIDVSEALTDPDFIDLLSYVRRSVAIGQDGLGVAVDSGPIAFSGVVTAGSGDTLNRIPEGERVSGNITIHTKTRLQSGSAEVTADIVTWRNAQYVVSRVSDYSNFGTGFVAAECDLLPIHGAPASTETQ